MRRAIYTFAALAACAIAGAAVTTHAFWNVGAATGSHVSALAASVERGATPSATATIAEGAGKVTLTWTASALSSGVAVEGYLVKRYEAGGAAQQATLAGCAGTIAATSCTETGVPDGQWQYTVTPKLASWLGAESARGATVTLDSTPPAGGSVEATGLTGTGARYATSTTLSVAFAKGADTGSGLAASGARLLRAQASLTSNGTADGSCGSYGSYIQVGATDPTSPKLDSVPADHACYRYEYLVPNNAGAVATYVSGDVKVDTIAPAAPAFSFSGLANAYWNAAASTLYYRPGASSGAFTLTASASEPYAGIASYAFPTFPSGWSATAGAFGVRTYSYAAANPTAPSGAQSVTATSNSARTSTASFTATPDSTAPSGGSVTYTNGILTSRSVPVTTASGTDAGAGVNAGAATLQRDQATLNIANGNCGTFPGTFASTVTLSASADTSVATGSCYKYRYVVSDNVGNQATYTSSSVAKVDAAPKVTAIAAQQSSGATGDGQLQNGDKLVLTFNEPLSAASVPSSFTAANETRASSGANVTLSIPGITSGALDTGSSGYVAWGGSTSVASFKGTVALANNGASTTLTITVAGLAGASTQASKGVLVFAPASTLQDAEGNAAAGSLSSNMKLF